MSNDIPLHRITFKAEQCKTDHINSVIASGRVDLIIGKKYSYCAVLNSTEEYCNRARSPLESITRLYNLKKIERFGLEPCSAVQWRCGRTGLCTRTSAARRPERWRSGRPRCAYARPPPAGPPYCRTRRRGHPIRYTNMRRAVRFSSSYLYQIH